MNSFRNNTLLIAAFLVGCIGLTTRAQAAPEIETVDQIVAVVNADIITLRELEMQLREISQQLRKQNIALPPRGQLEKQVLERMIVERAMLQQAKESGVRVDPVMVDRAMQRIAAQNEMTLEQLRESLTREGSYQQFRNRIQNEMLMTRARDRFVDSKISVSDAEIEAYLQSQTAQGKDEEFRLAHILVSVPENATPEITQARRERAQDILTELAKGSDFSQLSASYSDAPNALQGGNMGWKSAGQLPILFLEPARALKIGEVSQVMRSPNGFHILKLLDKRGTNATTIVTQTRVRHILIKPSEITSEADAIARLTQIRERIEQGGSKFEDMARQYSEDPGSATRGGELNWTNPGDTVPAFEKAMNALKPGELSQIVQSPFGWHLIQVLERRDQDVTQERQRMLARSAIRERKSDEAYEDWVRQVRDQAYVDIRTIE